MKKVLVSELINSFKADYAYLFERGAYITGVFIDQIVIKGDELNIGLSYAAEESDNVNPYQAVLSVSVNFFTDHRKLPKFYKGVKVQAGVICDENHPDSAFDETTEYLLEEGILDIHN